jgi:hypothetical protein
LFWVEEEEIFDLLPIRDRDAGMKMDFRELNVHRSVRNAWFNRHLSMQAQQHFKQSDCQCHKCSNDAPVERRSAAFERRKGSMPETNSSMVLA